MEFVRVKQFADQSFIIKKSKFKTEAAFHITTYVYCEKEQTLVVGLSNGKVMQFQKKGFDSKHILSTKEFEVVKFFDVQGSHKGDIRALCFELINQTRYIITGSSDRTIKIWENDNKAKSIVQTLVGHNGTIVALQYASSTDTLFSASNDKTLRIWKQEDGREYLYHPWYIVFQVIYDFSMKKGLGNQSYLSAFLMRETDILTLVAGDTEGSLHILRREETWKQTSNFIIEKSFFNFHRLHVIQILNIDKDNTLYTIGYDQMLLGFEEVAGKQFFSYKNPHKCLFTSIAWNVLQQELIASDEQGRIYFINVQTDKQVQEYKLYDVQINKVQVLNENLLIITDNFVDVLRMKRGVKAGNLQDAHRGPVIGLVAIEPPQMKKLKEPSRLVSASLDNTIRIWEPRDMSCTTVIENNYPNEISSLHLLQNANLLVTGHENGDIRLWNMELGTSLTLNASPNTRHHNMVCCLTSKIFKGQNNEILEFLYSSGYDGKLNVWEIFEKLSSGIHTFSNADICPQLKQSIPCNKNAELDSIGNEILSIIFDPNTNCIVTAGNKGDIYLIEMFTFDRRVIFRGHRDSVNCLAMDNRILFSGSDDKTIRLWDTLSSQYLTLIEAHETGVKGLLLINESGHLVSCAYGSIHVWNYPKKKLLQKFAKPENLKSMCYFNEDKSLFVGTEENNIFNYSFAEIIEDSQINKNEIQLLQPSLIPDLKIKGNKNVLVIKDTTFEEEKEQRQKTQHSQRVQLENLTSNDYLKQLEEQNQKILQELMKK